MIPCSGEGVNEMTLDDLVAIEAIRHLKARYFRALDGQDWPMMEQLFTLDASIDTTADGAPLLEGGAAFCAFLAPILAGVRTVHHGHTHEIDITEPDRASGVWAMEDRLWFPEDQGGACIHGFGWYRERYRADPTGHWQIASLRLDRVHVETDGVVRRAPTS